jgi:hypothetical protein
MGRRSIVEKSIFSPHHKSGDYDGTAVGKGTSEIEINAQTRIPPSSFSERTAAD